MLKSAMSVTAILFRQSLRRLVLCALLPPAVAVCVRAEGLSGEALLDFNRDIRPILSENCFYCHGQDGNKRQADLRLDDRDFELCARQRTLPRPLTDTEMASVRNAMEQAAGLQIAFLERRLTLLGVIVTTSPLLGLFGTTWGILVTFCAVADKGHATLATLVPGISGALLATLAGLTVAIPAAAAYNLLVRQVQLIGTDLAAFMDDLLDGLRRTEDR